MRFGLIPRTLYSDSAKKGASLNDVVSATKCSHSTHIAEIAEYVQTNLRGKYVLGALTLNASQELNLVVVGRGGIADMRQGYLILPRSAKISITDGQHRENAVTRLIDALSPDDREELARQAMAVIITTRPTLTDPSRFRRRIKGEDAATEPSGNVRYP